MCVGAEARRAVSNLPLKIETYEQLVEALTKLFAPRRTEAYFSYMLSRRKQKFEEDVQDYASDLRRLAGPCKYGEVEDRILRDKFIEGIRSEAARRQILATDLVDFEKAVDIASRVEAAEKDSRALSSTSDDSVHALNRSTMNRKRKARGFPKINCHRCGNVHERGLRVCPARGSRCTR